MGGGQLDIRPPNLKIGGGRVPPIPPRIDAPEYESGTTFGMIMRFRDLHEILIRKRNRMFPVDIQLVIFANFEKYKNRVLALFFTTS